MNKWREMYQQKLTTAEEAVKLIKPGNYVATTIGTGEPPALLEAMAKDDELTNITHCQLLALRKSKFLEPEMASRFRHVSWFTGGAGRKPVQEGRADFVPCFYHEIPMLHTDYWDYDVFFCSVSRMDEHGWFSFGTSVSSARAIRNKSKKVILEVNNNFPRTLGNSMIHISEVDALIENHSPMFELPIAPITETDKIIGESIAELVPDGATIQLGIGGIPNAAAMALCGKKDLGIHTEMFTDGMIDMIECGAVTNAKKNLHKYKCIATFAMGSQRLYDYINDNLGVEFHPVSYTNDPNTIAAHDNFISINACIEVDLIGQVCSESIGPVHFSGTGGQVDFVRGCSKSKGGKSFITMYSTAKKGTISKVVPMLTPGAHVTTSKNDVDYVVTEYGVAKLKGKTARERALAMISIAHPDFREELTQAARKMFLIP